MKVMTAKVAAILALSGSIRGSSSTWIIRNVKFSPMIDLSFIIMAKTTTTATKTTITTKMTTTMKSTTMTTAAKTTTKTTKTMD